MNARAKRLKNKKQPSQTSGAGSGSLAIIGHTAGLKPKNNTISLRHLILLYGRPLLQAFVIIAAALWIYGPVLRGDWLWDDDVLITDNLQLRSLDGLEKIWCSPLATDYWPLTWTLLWIEWHLWGDDSLGYHLCSLALHICSGFLIWRLLGRLGLRRGWLGGLFFVIHPLAVESVAWASEIKNCVSLPFFLLSLDAWMDEDEGVRPGYLKSLLCYLAAMLCKTSTVMLPFVLLGYCWWKRGTITQKEFKKIFPYLAIALVLGLVTVYIQARNSDADPEQSEGLIARLSHAGPAVFFYLGKFVLPVHLLPIYPQTVVSTVSLAEFLSLPLLGIILLGLWRQRGDWGRHALFGFGFFLINLIPVLGFLKMTYLSISGVADHFVYLPMIGLIGLVVASGEQIGRRFFGGFRVGGIGVAAIAMGLLVCLSRAYAERFVSPTALWTYTLERNSQAWPAHNDLGNILHRSGQIPEAIGQFEQVVQLKPDWAKGHNNLGAALKDSGRTPEAIDQFKQALQIWPDYAEAHNNLGSALLASGQVREAIDQFEQALRIDPNIAEADYNLGNALRTSGRLQEALDEYSKAIQIKPDFAEAHSNLGDTLRMSGHLQEALDEYSKAIQIKPDYAEAHNNLGDSLRLSGRVPEAIDQLKLALQIKPDFADAHNNLGIALAQAGRMPEAIDQIEQSLKLKPDNAVAHYNLGLVFMQRSRIPEAIDQFAQALKINPDLPEARKYLTKLQAGERAAPTKVDH